MVTNSDILDSGFLDYEIFPLQEKVENFCEGSNQRGLFLAGTGEYSPSLANFLEKIMKSVNYDIQQDALVMWLTTPTPFSFASLQREHLLRHAVFFGVPLSQAGLKLNFIPYQPTEVGGVQFLLCHPLQKIQDDPALKRQLWEALKSMFLG